MGIAKPGRPHAASHRILLKAVRSTADKARLQEIAPPFSMSWAGRLTTVGLRYMTEHVAVEQMPRLWDVAALTRACPPKSRQHRR
jgi:hypothetical protein